MTTPPSDENADATARVSPPPDAVPQPAADAQTPLAPHALPPAAPPAYPFAPVARPPRVPWVNPDRRVHVAGAAIVGAVVLLGAGIGIGVAVGGDEHHHRGYYRMELGPAYFPGGPGGPAINRFPRRFPGPRQFPTAPAATPSPTSTK